MLVSGYYATPIQVEVSDKELIKGLIDSFGLVGVFHGSTDSYWKEVYDDSNNLISLDKYTDISYHGSPSYQFEGSSIQDPQKLQAYSAIKELIILIKAREADRD